MDKPTHRVKFTPEQVKDLNRKLADLRHNVNNHLAMLVAAAELIRRKPELAPRIADALIEQPRKITEEIKTFSDEFEKVFGITED